jgi:glycosyltransferase involved in cell wall biosynthesis
MHNHPTPKFSIITVTYNAEAVLEDTIQSVISQTYHHVEYILVDGASKDGTLSIIDRYRDRITRIVSEPDKGLYDAMNKGIRLATGDYLCFLNAGDSFHEDDTLQQMVRSISGNELPDVLYGETELLDKDARHIPYGALSPEAAERSAVMMAPSKTFNIAGLCCSFAVIPNARLRLKLQQAMRGISADVNLLGFVAAEAAYEGGEQWLNEQLDYLAGNLALIEQAVARWPGVKLARNQATYLAWIDMSALGLDDPVAFFEQAGVGLSPGAQFGNGQFVRLNFGCTRARLTEALARMEKAILQTR